MSFDVKYRRCFGVTPNYSTSSNALIYLPCRDDVHLRQKRPMIYLTILNVLSLISDAALTILKPTLFSISASLLFAYSRFIGENSETSMIAVSIFDQNTTAQSFSQPWCDKILMSWSRAADRGRWSLWSMAKRSGGTHLDAWHSCDTRVDPLLRESPLLRVLPTTRLNIGMSVCIFGLLNQLGQHESAGGTVLA